MKIGIDISQIVYKGTGVARYIENLIDAILKCDDKNQYIFFFSSLRRSLPKNIENQIKEKHVVKIYRLPPSLLEILWNRLHIYPIEKFIGPVDIFISSDWTQPPAGANKMTIVHDLVFLKYPETLPKSIIDVQTRRMERVKKEIDLIIADSQSTKDDLIELLQIPENKIEVVYPAVQVDKPDNLTIEQFDNGRQFILSVGKLEPRKNISRLISAFTKSNLKDVNLVIVGPKGWDNQQLAIKQSNNLTMNIKFLGYIPDQDLYALYSKALFFIYPSLYEGFGYPIIEAMSLGCPVATSNTSSLKEIGKDSALLFNPESEEEIKNAIVKLYEDKDLRNKLISAGKKRARDFSLEKFAASFNQYLSK